MSQRWCQCRGCPSCQTTGTCGTVFDADVTKGTKCPGCQQQATAKRNARAAASRTEPPGRPSAAQRGYGAQWRRISRQVTAGATACHWCGRAFTKDDPATADHITPKARGGTDDLANLVPAHRSCNSRRGGQLRKPSSR